MAHLALLALALLPASGIASPLPKATPAPTLLPRRLAPLPVDIGHNATRTLAERQSAPASTTVRLSSAAASSTETPIYSNNFFGAGIPSTMLIYVAAAISGGLVLALLVARYFFIKRHYPPTFRAYFIPVKGIHVGFLGLHIDGPPPRPPREAPPHYFSAVSIQRRRRRDRTTRGEGIGEGGVRMGERDEDDAYEGEGGAHDPGNELPMYVMETGLPAYNNVDGEIGERDGNLLPPVVGTASHSTATSPVDPSAATTSPPTTADDDVLPSVQDYENATRQARLAAAAPSYPPRPPTTRAASSFGVVGGTATPSTSREAEEDRSSMLTGSSGNTKVEDAKKALDGEGKDVGEERMIEHAPPAAGEETATAKPEQGETEMVERSRERD